jgi:hypothetical protein
VVDRDPWKTHTRFLISHRLLIDEQYAGPLSSHTRESMQRTRV